MGLLVKLQPKVARARLRSLLEEVGGSAPAAAKRYGVVRRTFDRWLAELGLQETAARFRERLASKETP
jgi:hypothetical protein